MAVIAEFSVHSDDFALHHALTAAPEMIVEIERVVATMKDRIMPYFWVTGETLSEFERALDEDNSVKNITEVDVVEDAKLYRAEWTENIETVIFAYVEIGATILQASGRNDRWELQMRFDDQEKVADFREYCDENDVSFELLQLQEQEQPMASTQYDLTPKQRETLISALEEGYYEVPQQVTMSELAAEMGISQQALSKRFHNAHKNLITNVLTVSEPDEP
ncbi:helix-turn-helix domain-containing protein [Natronorubrum daqingense]|uniref:Bacterio-opsin activator n=1 Tax=Natronorubrum daqingense TaxID=588898 RepID=A0A1N7DUL9_9EURY|nr:bacterio-opsin activator domain-containing protein [Natronorubrum daqingense]APX96186.1 bacterio-opsin activator [Natronorubrum daqingense]SIR79562.1 hypothetical protein SAMN05421809_2254 [Natronorubrum daqingense]